MPWSTSTRRTRLPKDWHARRAACYRNAGGRCQWTTNGQRCTWTGPLNGTKQQPGGHADHIDRAQGEHGPLQWLCPTHHNRKSSAEGHAARPARQRTTPPHPGLIK
jgi:hypothetical protein